MTPAALAALHAAAMTDPRPWTEAEFTALLARPGARLIAEADGFALVHVAAGEAELLTLAVAPPARRRGTGMRLLAAALQAAADEAAVMFLEVAETNAAARALYARAGFSEAGRRRGYYAGADALVLRKSLT